MADLGKTSAGTHTQTGTADRIYVSIFTAPSSGDITAISGYLAVSEAGTYRAKGVVFNVSAGVPTSRIAISGEVTVTETVTPVLKTAAVSSGSIVGGQQYAVGWHLEDPGTPSYVIERDNTPNQTQRMGDTYSDGTVTTWGSGSTENGPIRVWATYTPAPGSDTADRHMPRGALRGVKRGSV